MKQLFKNQLSIYLLSLFLLSSCDTQQKSPDPFAPSHEGYDSHKKFKGAIHEQKYAIWENMSYGEINKVKPLVAKKVPTTPTQGSKFQFDLGSGSFGTTYVGCNCVTGELVAIKKVFGNFEVNQSLQEGRLQDALKNCPQIMTLIDYRNFTLSEPNESPRLFQAMPLAYTNGDGYNDMLAPLRQHDKTLYERIMIDNIEQLLKGLSYMHQKKIYHLDIKADNILYMLDGSLRIADFGRAQQGKETTDQISGEQLGDRTKYAPEQFAFVRFLRQQEGQNTASGEVLSSFSGRAADTWAGGLYILESFLDRELFDEVSFEEKVQSWDSAKFQTILDKISYLQGTAGGLGNLLKKLLYARFQERLLPEQALAESIFKTNRITEEERSQVFNGLRTEHYKKLYSEEFLSNQAPKPDVNNNSKGPMPRAYEGEEKPIDIIPKELGKKDILALARKVKMDNLSIEEAANHLNSALSSQLDFTSVVKKAAGDIGDIGVQVITKALETNKTLTKLNLGYNKLSDLDVQVIASALKMNKTLAKLNLGNNKIGNVGAQAIASVLETSKTLTELNLDGNNIGEGGGAQAIAIALGINKTLKNLDLCDNKIGEEGAQAIAKTLEANKILTELSLRGNNIGKVGAQAIAKTLTTNEALINLNLGYNKFGEEGAQAIASALKMNKTLAKLNLDGNKIGGIGAQAIASALKMNKTLAKLNLGGNKIGGIGAQAIASALETSKTLTELNLGSNNIGEVGGAQAIASALESNKTLTSLTLERNEIGKIGAQAIAKALGANTTLTDLNLYSNNIGGIGAQAIADVLAINKTLTSLGLGGNKIGAVGAQAIAKTLKTNEVLIKLNLCDNSIGEVGVQAIASALKINKTLTSLDLYDNEIGKVGAKAIAKALKRNVGLKWIKLSFDVDSEVFWELKQHKSSLAIMDGRAKSVSNTYK